MKKKKSRTAAIVSLILIAGAAAFFAVWTGWLVRTKNAELDRAKEQAGREKEVLSGQIALLEEEVSSLKEKIGELEGEILLFDQKDALYAVMNGQLEEYKTQYENSLERIASLRADLDRLTGVFHFDINEQRELLNRLEACLENEIPQKATQVDVPTPENLAKEADEREKETVLSDARVALYYKDLTTGYSYSYRADEIFDSASLIKLPFALSILETWGEDSADPDEIFTFDPETDETEGSGVIRLLPEKTDFTYLELVSYMLKHSDNVAFAALREKYGYSPMANWCAAHDVRGLLKNGLSNQTASDGGAILEALYAFIEENGTYGTFVRDALMNSTHLVIIPFGVSPKKTAHKYGWAEEAYHDIGIVYGEHPYILAVMSDLHQGGAEVNSFLQKVVRMIDEFHSNFYREVS